MIFSDELKKLLALSVPRARYWLTDAVENSQADRNDISEAADDFVAANAPTLGNAESCRLANSILIACGAEPIFSCCP